MSAPKKKKIVFVCTGNTCRSPMAERLLKKTLEERGLRGFTVLSAGTKAKRGEPMNPKSAAVLQEHGIGADNFSAKRVTPSTLRDAFAIVCMTEGQRDYLLELRWNVMRKTGAEEVENNVYAFSDLTGNEVLDPYGKDLECYRYVYALLATGMSKVVEGLRLAEYALPPKKKGRPKKKTSDGKNVAENKEKKV